MNYALHGRVMRSMIPRVGLKRTDEFRQDAVRIALTSGLTRKQVADDLGVHCPAGDCKAICREGGCRR